MPTEELIRQTVNGLKAAYALQSVSIFGSYAEGRATDKSDLDLLVEFEQPTVSLLKLNYILDLIILLLLQRYTNLGIHITI